MKRNELEFYLNEWARTDLFEMVSHISATCQGGCSIEKWITPAVGRYLCSKLKINPCYIHYEKKYLNSKYRCDLWIDENWLEIKHIWQDTQSKVLNDLNSDIERITSVNAGFLVVFEIGQPEWYKNWKILSHSNVIFVPMLKELT